MTTRKIKDAKDLDTNELIYFKSHAKATYMSDGRSVEDAINNINSGGGTDIDLSEYAKKTDLNNKQDIISDLDTIRNGASAGATALQSVPSEYVTETELAEAIASAITNTLNTAV